MDVIKGADAFVHLRASQWWVLLSNSFFILTAYMAKARRQWIRMVGFVIIVPASFLYHLSVDTTVLEPSVWYDRADQITAVYLSVTAVLLVANFTRQRYELVVELCLVPPIVTWGWYVGEWNVGEWIYLMPPLAVFFCVVVPTWLWMGLPSFRHPISLFWGVLLGCLAISSFLVNNHLKNEDTALTFHGIWHASAALSLALLMYVFRDHNGGEYEAVFSDL